MCVYSMVVDHYYDKWSFSEIPSRAEIADFHKLLERARDYDKKNNEPACESDEKKAKLQRLADELGIDISFNEE